MNKCEESLCYLVELARDKASTSDLGFIDKLEKDILELVEKSEKYGWRSPGEVPTEKRNDWSSVNILIQTTENKDGFRPNTIMIGWYDYNEKQFLHEDMGFDDEHIYAKTWRYIEPFEEN